jgi:hypothetical protein
MDTKTLTLDEFLLARIADTQAEALELGRIRSIKNSPAVRTARERLIKTEAAYRHIVWASRDYSPELAEGDNGEWAFDLVLCILASTYADHPDYRDEWRP